MFYRSRCGSCAAHVGLFNTTSRDSSSIRTHMHGVDSGAAGSTAAAHLEWISLARCLLLRACCRLCSNAASVSSSSVSLHGQYYVIACTTAARHLNVREVLCIVQDAAPMPQLAFHCQRVSLHARCHAPPVRR